ncbi:MAG: hypothetical protein H6815_00340 [Phycisphaeraceae bacterium]|nr:hypothetical protein [Phycisphaerales bacterium]MCB9858872.1 hypothetical protein [Phycisphaeraceae bacterium]
MAKRASTAPEVAPNRKKGAAAKDLEWRMANEPYSDRAQKHIKGTKKLDHRTTLEAALEGIDAIVRNPDHFEHTTACRFVIEQCCGKARQKVEVSHSGKVDLGLQIENATKSLVKKTIAGKD